MPFNHLQRASNRSAIRIDFDALRAALDHADCRVRSFIVMHDGERVFEHFGHGATPDSLEEVNSVTKSVVALAVGIALDEGHLPNLDAPIADFLATARDPALDARVRRITLRHLLTMTAGFAWNPETIDECVLGACERFDAHDDHDDHDDHADHDARLRFILSRPFAHDPGDAFAYDSHAVHVLSHVIESATGRTLARYADEKLFAPLSIARHAWLGDEAGHAFAARGLALRTRDMAALGVLMSRRGTCNDTRVIGAEFIDQALRAHSEGGPPMQPARYGFLWWIAPDYAFAAGFGGQLIGVARDAPWVVAATSERDEANLTALKLFETHVAGIAR